GLRHPPGLYATGEPAGMVTAKKTPPQRVFWSLVRRSGGVAAQPSRELFEVADAARLGAVAPVLQLADKLLARRARALPQRDELGAHRVHRVQGARLREPLVEVRALRLAERPLVAVQPALEALQDVGVVRGEAAQLAELLGVGALQRLGVGREHVVAVRDDRLQRREVDRLLLGEARGRSDLLHLGQAERLKNADVHPT